MPKLKTQQVEEDAQKVAAVWNEQGEEAGAKVYARLAKDVGLRHWEGVIFCNRVRELIQKDKA